STAPALEEEVNAHGHEDARRHDEHEEAGKQPPDRSGSHTPVLVDQELPRVRGEASSIGFTWSIVPRPPEPATRSFPDGPLAQAFCERWALRSRNAVAEDGGDLRNSRLLDVLGLCLPGSVTFSDEATPKGRPIVA